METIDKVNTSVDEWGERGWGLPEGTSLQRRDHLISTTFDRMDLSRFLVGDSL